MEQERLNAYRVMWVLVMYDLPTETKADRKHMDLFRKAMLKDGFQKFQFSFYLRHCASKENADVHVNRVKSMLPPKGHIGILNITDKQFGQMELFQSAKPLQRPEISQQLELF